MRYDIAFLLCCCKSFLGSSDEEDFYSLLGLERDASPDEIKRAYKKQSLKMHPDKLAQRGLTVTPEAQAEFQKMKEAYECLRDPHKKEAYDAIGSKGLKWIEDPMSMDPQELATNFVNASILDRSKIFAIFVAIVAIILYLPVIVCLHVDGVFGPQSSWVLTLIPLWLANLLGLFSYSRLLAMPSIPKPDDIPEEDWIDPLPMHKRIFSSVRFLLIAIFEVLLALKLDDIISFGWAYVFAPLLLWEATNIYQSWKVISSSDIGLLFQQAHEMQQTARQDLMKAACRILFETILIVQFDTSLDLNWWLTFLPFWITIFLVCMANYQAFAKVKMEAVQKDPELFGLAGANVDYGSVGNDGAATPAATAAYPPLSEEEKAKLKEEVVNSGSRLCTQCCSQGFVLLILCLIVSKLQGATFSTLWLISPLLFAAGILLCCLGIAIFGVTEVPDPAAFEAEGFGTPTTNYQAATTAYQTPAATTTTTTTTTATTAAPAPAPPIVLGMAPNTTKAEPEKDIESQTAEEVTSAASQNATEIRELD